MRSVPARAFLLLAAASVAARGGLGLLDLGLYHDDWAIFSHMRFASGGPFGAMRALAEHMASLHFRPATFLLYPPLFALFGSRPLPWQLALALVNCGLAFAVYRLLRRFQREPALAALGALLVLAHPSKDATMFWPVAMVNPLSFWLFLEATLAAWSYAQDGRISRLAAALGLLLLSFGLYDQTLLLFPVWLLIPGGGATRARARAAFLGAAVVAGVYVAYKLGLAPRWAGPFHQPVAFSPGRLSVYLSGLDALFGPSLLRHCAWALSGALRERPLVSLAAAALPWLAPRLLGPGAEATRGAAPPLLWGASLIVLGYAPLIPSDYTPDGVSLGNRLNLIPAAGVVLLAVAAASAASRRRGLPALCAAASLALVVHVGFAGLWIESYRRQLAVREVVMGTLERWPADRTLLVYIPERFLDGKVMIFDAHWDIGGAVQLWTGDESRTADMLSRRHEVIPEGVVVRGSLLPYSRFMILDVPNRRIAPASYELLRAFPRT